MTREDIIRMARAAGIARWHKDLKKWVFDFGLEHFAALVAAQEREACAKVCEDLSLSRNSDWEIGTLDCAAAIRARKDQT